MSLIPYLLLIAMRLQWLSLLTSALVYKTIIYSAMLKHLQAQIGMWISQGKWQFSDNEKLELRREFPVVVGFARVGLGPDRRSSTAESAVADAVAETAGAAGCWPGLTHRRLRGYTCWWHQSAQSCCAGGTWNLEKVIDVCKRDEFLQNILHTRKKALCPN